MVDLMITRLSSDATIPSYAHDGDVGLDLYSCERRTLERGEPHLFRLGFATQFSDGYVALIQDRSSMGKRGVRVLGGVIDPGFRGEWGVILINLTDHEVLISPGDRIAQALFVPAARASISEGSLAQSARGEGGFGSSGR